MLLIFAHFLFDLAYSARVQLKKKTIR